MYDEIKTMEQYLCCLDRKRSVYWEMLRKLEDEGSEDSPDYHRSISAWAAYDTAINLFQELMRNTRKENEP